MVPPPAQVVVCGALPQAAARIATAAMMATAPIRTRDRVVRMWWSPGTELPPVQVRFGLLLLSAYRIVPSWKVIPEPEGLEMYPLDAGRRPLGHEEQERVLVLAPDQLLAGAATRGGPTSWLKGSRNGIRRLRPAVRAALRARRRSHGRAQADHAQPRHRCGRRPQRDQVRVVSRAPLPRRVQPHARARGVPVQPGGPHRAGARRIGHLQHHAAGQPPGPGGRDGGVDGPHHRGSLRVRHRPRLVDDRGLRLRHRRPRRDLEDVGRGHQRDPEDVEGRRVLLRGHLLPHAAA